MNNNFTHHKHFIFKVALLYMCLFISMWIGNSNSLMTGAQNIAHIGNIFGSPMLIQMLNKWYFIGF